MERFIYEDFIFRLSEKAKQKKRLLGVDWVITYKCNLNCRHCYLPVEKRKDTATELSLLQIKNIIDQLYALGCLSIALTGGEVFTRKDASEILGCLKGRGFHLFLVTNGTLITEKIATLLSEFRPLIDISISLYGLDEKINNQLVGVKGALKMALNGAKLLKQRNVAVSIGTLVMRNNLEEFEAIKGFARRHNIRFSYDYIVQPRLDGSKDVLKYQLPVSAIKRLRDKEQDFLKIGDDCRQLKMVRFSKQSIFYCSAGRNSMAIDPYGKANICLDLPFPESDILKDGVALSWQKIVEFVKTVKPRSDYHCYKCKLGDFCVWCPAMGWRHKKDFHACIPFYKRLAQMERKVFYGQG